MNEAIIAVLKKRIEESAGRGAADAEIVRNSIKEELQYYVLNFIYHHPRHCNWVMYGGSALRIIHNLDRMSIDLDFEISEKIDRDMLDKLKKEIEVYFSSEYNVNQDFLAVKIAPKRGLILKFNIGEVLGLGHASNQVHVKIDLNIFAYEKSGTERFPVNRDQLSFVILSYKLSTLMASKIAAIFLRGRRGVGKALYEEKGRDIYDLLWYMNNKIVPDLDYLSAKNVKEAEDLRALFDKLTIRMNRVSDANLKQDLLPLFVNRSYIENWLENWRESYLHFVDSYQIFTITSLKSLQVHQHFDDDSVSFTFEYNTEEDKTCRVRYVISDYWIEFREGDLPTNIILDENVEKVIKFTRDGISSNALSEEKLKKYAALFYRKNENYLKKTNRIMIGRSISTKGIRMTADNLNQKEQIVLTKSALLSCELEDLLK